MRRWWQRRSLRFRLALWYSAGGALLLALFSATIYSYVADRVAHPLAQDLQADLQTIRTHLSLAPDGTLRWDGRVIPADATWDDEEPWFELWDGQGRLVRRLWPFTETRLDRVPAAPISGSDTLSIFRVSSGIRLRVYSTPIPGPGPDGDWMIRILRIHEPLQDSLTSLLAIILISLPLVVLLLVAGGYLITRHWLRPLEKMVRQAEEITADNLSLRLPDGGSGDELGRLAGTFNRTLARLEDSFRTLDRFVADAAHELRTPLTTLRSVGEVGLRRSRTVEEYREIIGSMLEEAARLHQLVERLLELASTEGGAKGAQCERVQLDELVATGVQDISILAEARDQQIEVQAESCMVDSDPVLLRQAFQNLVDNALKYSPAGATIRVVVSRIGAEVRIDVIDAGPGIPPAHAARISDRFYRVEDSRERGRGGFGLGLALTKAYLRMLGGRLEHAPGRPTGSCFSLVLPASGPMVS